MRLQMSHMPIAARGLARALRVLALPLVLCSVDRAPAQPADPADPQPQDLSFAPCADAPSLECGTLQVPVRYDFPDRTVGLAVARSKALDPSRRIGVLFVHPGGHASGVDFLRDVMPNVPAFQRIHQRFDVVSLDPRGTGRSSPLHCDFDLPPPPPGQGDATLIAYLDDYSRRIATQCLDEDAEFVRSISGNNFARDIETFRRALGVRQLTLGMASNSGPVGAVYASMFPGRVRAMLIDSPVGPEHREYWIERRTEQGGSYERTLRRLDQICARSLNCPVFQFGLVNAFDEVTRRLALQPIPLPSGASFGPKEFALTFFDLLPREFLWRNTATALAMALNGDLTPFISIYNSGGPAADDGIVARFCNDYGPRRTAADYLPIAEAAGSVNSRFFDYEWMRYDAALCAAWPSPDPPAIRNVAKEAVPVLMFHSEFDSDAPFAWSQRLSQALGTKHIVRYQGGGHGVIDRQQPCIANTVDAFLFDLRLPAENLACPAEVLPSATATEAAAGPRAIAGEGPLRLGPGR